jgi:ABC-type Fe3+ transport system permease subunit
LIVLGASVRVNKDDCSPVQARFETYCTRTNFGIALGAIGFAFAFLIVAFKLFFRSSSVLCEFIPALTFAIIQAFGVGYITSKDGPGSSLGNLWMGSWLSFLVSGGKKFSLLLSTK